MFHEVDIDFWTRVAGAAWVILVGVFTLILSLLAVLLPFFVWRILHWSRTSAQELSSLNTRMEHLLRWLASSLPSGDQSEEFTFSAPREAWQGRGSAGRRARGRRRWGAAGTLRSSRGVR